MEKYIEYEYDKERKTREIGETIPYLNFPNEWEVKITPPFSGASIRFMAKKNDKTVSVYLDCFNSLGYVGEPYWEIYPAVNGDCERFLLNEHKEMIKSIDKSLNN